MRGYLDCFYTLQQPGNGMGGIPPIPFFDVMKWCDEMDLLDTESRVYFYSMVAACDKARADYYATKQPG